MSTPNIVTLDFETSKKPNMYPWQPKAFVVMASVLPSEKPVEALLFNHKEKSEVHQGHTQKFKTLIENSNLIISHKAKFEMLWLLELGINIFDLNFYCTKSAEYVLSGQSCSDDSLEALAEKYDAPRKIGDKVKEYWDNGYETDEIPLDLLVEYCNRDVEATQDIAFKQLEIIKKNKNMEQLLLLEMEKLKELAWAEYNGMLLDFEIANCSAEKFISEIRAIDTKLVAALECDIPSFNFASSEHLSAFLFGGIIKVDGEEWVIRTYKKHSRYYPRKCKVDLVLKGIGFTPPDAARVSKKDGVYSVNADKVLSILKPRNKKQKEVLSLLLERAKLTKAISTYYLGLVDKAEEDERVHPSLNNNITKTGRLSSSNPNGQNIPRSSTTPVKAMFISRYND